MRIAEAYYIEGDTKEPIRIDELSSAKYENKYQGKLFCGVDCPARLVYVEKQFHGRLIAYLRTWQDDKHNPGCVNEVVQEKGGRAKRTSASVEVTLTDDQIKQIMHDTYLVASGKKKVSTGSGNKKGTSSLSNGEDSGTEKVIGTGTLSNTAGDKKVDRHENIYKVPVNELNDTHIDSLHSIWGPLGDISIEEAEIKIHFITTNGQKIYAYFGEGFKNQFNQAFELLGNVEVYSKLLKEKGIAIELTVLGNVQKQKGEFIIPIDREYAFAVDGYNVYRLPEVIKKLRNESKS